MSCVYITVNPMTFEDFMKPLLGWRVSEEARRGFIITDGTNFVPVSTHMPHIAFDRYLGNDISDILTHHECVSEHDEGYFPLSDYLDDLADAAE